MATLDVLDPFAYEEENGHPANVDDEVQDHAALRTITFSGATGSFVAGEDVAFAPSGATGIVAAWDAGTLTLSYYLVPTVPSATVLADLPYALIALIDGATLEPAIDDSASSDSGTGTAATSVDSGGDEWTNDGQTVLYVKNDGESALSMIVPSVHKCTAGTYHTDRFDIGAGKSDRIGPFPKARFNDDRTGRMSCRWMGSTANGDVGVVPVRIVPRP